MSKSLLTFPRSESSYQTGRLLLYTAALRAARLKDFPLLLEIPSAGRVARGRSNCAAKLHRAGDPGAAPEGQATRSEGAEGWSTI